MPGAASAISQGYLIFQVRARHYAVVVSEVSEILRYAELASEPNAPRLLAGMLNRNGCAIPILQLAHLLGDDPVPTPAGTQTAIIIARHGSQLVGLVVDKVSHTLAATGKAVTELSKNALLPTALFTEGQLFPIVSLSNLLMEEEKARLEQLRALHQTRLRSLEGACQT